MQQENKKIGKLELLVLTLYATVLLTDVLTDVPSSELCAGHLSPIKTI